MRQMLIWTLQTLDICVCIDFWQHDILSLNINHRLLCWDTFTFKAQIGARHGYFCTLTLTFTSRRVDCDLTAHGCFLRRNVYRFGNISLAWILSGWLNLILGYKSPLSSHTGLDCLLCHDERLSRHNSLGIWPHGLLDNPALSVLHGVPGKI